MREEGTGERGRNIYWMTEINFNNVLLNEKETSWNVVQHGSSLG